MSRLSSWLRILFVLFAGLPAAAAVADPKGAWTPSAGQVVSGVIPVSGYVLDFAGVDKVELFVDGSLRSRARTDIPRPDVIALFPSYASSPTSDPGFATSLNTTSLSSGPHLVTIRVTETGNAKTFDLATVTVFVSTANANAVPFGALESPDSDGIVLSGSFPVAGWALTTPGRSTTSTFSWTERSGGSGRRRQARPGPYGLPRPDVFALFPDVPNSFNSGFVANIDTTAFQDGVHRISVRAFDSQGGSNLLGTRSVMISNVGASLAPFGFLDAPQDEGSLFCSSDNPSATIDRGHRELPTRVDGLAVPAFFYKNSPPAELDVGARDDRSGSPTSS